MAPRLSVQRDDTRQNDTQCNNEKRDNQHYASQHLLLFAISVVFNYYADSLYAECLCVRVSLR
jgi:hypothetical protein